MATTIPENRVVFTLEDIVHATGGQLRGAGMEPTRQVCGVFTDSRRARPDALFVALEGERVDAHRFVEQVASSGAISIVRRGRADVPNVPRIEVIDTLRALGDLAAYHRRRWPGTVVGITGSVGKTTTKTLVTEALRATGANVWATPGNLNNRVGVPMTVFMLDQRYDTAVLEMGTSEPGEIARLVSITSPHVGVVTRVALSHVAGLGTLEGVAQEKGAMFRGLAPEGIAIGYADDEHVRRALGQSPAARRIGYGAAASAVVRLEEIRPVAFDEGGAGARAEVGVAGRRVSLRLAMFGEGALLNAAAALAVVRALGRDVQVAADALAGVTPPPGRMALVTAPGDVTIVDDTYNANPSSTRNALATATALAEAKGARLVVALGDMKELGDDAADAHDEIVRGAVSAGAAALVAVGDEMDAACDRVEPRDVVVRRAGGSEAAALMALAVVRAGDVVLVKGSRSMRMERIVDALRREAQATEEGAA